MPRSATIRKEKIEMDAVAKAAAIAARLASVAASGYVGKKRKLRGENVNAAGSTRKFSSPLTSSSTSTLHIGLLIGPQGSNQRRMDLSGAINPYGKGSSKVTILFISITTSEGEADSHEDSYRSHYS
jgi:hypothetical protein